MKNHVLFPARYEHEPATYNLLCLESHVPVSFRKYYIYKIRKIFNSLKDVRKCSKANDEQEKCHAVFDSILLEWFQSV